MFLQLIYIIINAYYVIGQDVWREVVVDIVHFTDWPANQIPPMSVSSLKGSHCAASCDQNALCTAFCFYMEFCLLYSHLVVSPLFNPTYYGPTFLCYTRLEKDYIVGSSVTYSSYNPTIPSRTAANLAKGVYDTIDYRTCSGTDDNTIDPWILFDLGEKKTIREIRIRTSPSDQHPADDVQVKVGRSPPSTAGDFSTFRFFGQLPNPTEEGKLYIFKHDVPMKGRYISIQKLGSVPLLVICQVMAL